MTHYTRKGSESFPTFWAERIQLFLDFLDSIHRANVNPFTLYSHFILGALSTFRSVLLPAMPPIILLHEKDVLASALGADDAHRPAAS